MKKTVFLLAIFIVFFGSIVAQNIVITDDDMYTADPSAMLDVKSLTKGFLTPRLSTAQRNAISSPATGLLVYDTDINGYYYYNGSTWVNLTSGSANGLFWNYNAPNIYMSTSTDKLGLGTSSPVTKLHLYESVAVTDGTDGNIVTIQNSNVVSGVMSGIRFFNGTTLNTAKGGIFYQDRLSYGRGDLILANRELGDGVNATTSDARLTIKSEGNVVVEASSAIGVNDAIFSVQNPNGDTVFAVYPEGVRVWVNDDGGSKATGNRGGFAVGGFSPAKAGFTNEYLRVTPDSVRVYINDDYVSAKATGSRGGFAVGGFSPAKGSPTENYLFVQDDSTRVYVNGDEGFAVDNIDQLSSAVGRYMDMSPENYFIGHHSGDAITTGKHNSFFGFETGLVSTAADKNVFIGYQAGYSNTSADENNFIGYQAGYSNTTGIRNNFIGYEAGYNNTTGHRNTFVGTSAGKANTDGQYNSLYGHYSGYGADLGDNNFFAGFYSGYDADNAEDCIMIGSRSGYAADNSSNSIFLGTYSGYNNNAENNILIGYYAGYSNTTGSNNTILGTYAGYSNGSGIKNVFIGYKSGYSNNGGSENIFIGNDAGGLNTSGNYNTYLGDSAGYSNTGGYYNVYLGFKAGKESTTSNSTFIGAGAGKVTTGMNNTFVGNSCGIQNASGAGNVFLGALAGVDNISGGDNLFLGYYTGFNNISGNDNVYVGKRAGYNATGSANVFIGHEAGYDETGSNKLYIDNSSTTTPLIYGDFNYDRVGINEAVPTANLHIKQVGTNEEGLCIENDGNTNRWSWEVSSTWLYLSYNGTDVGYWNNTSGAYVDVSDKRLKKDIEVINDPIIDRIMGLELVSYRLNHADENTPKIYGYIAQDVQKVFPEIVQQGENGYMGLNYDNFGIISIKAIQEQQEIIDEQNAKIKQLEEKIDFLINEINKMKK